MDEVPILSSDDPQRTFQLFLGQYSVPAYVRRARQVQDAFDQVLARCCRQREEWLQLPRWRLGVLRDLAGDWSALGPWLDPGQIAELKQLADRVQPVLRVAVQRTPRSRPLRRALKELGESFERFNGRWLRYLHSLDLQPVNALIDGYNRYYLLEKECAFRSARLARQGFSKLEPVTPDRLPELLPLLPRIVSEVAASRGKRYD